MWNNLTSKSKQFCILNNKDCNDKENGIFKNTKQY